MGYGSGEVQMRESIIIRDSIIIQASWGDLFQDMMRITYQRHSAYAKALNFDYWHINGHIHPETFPGGWDKIYLIKYAMQHGYKNIAWIDADAAIMDFEADLRDALKDKPFDIGACLHTPEKSEYLKQNNVPPHMNVGVMYWRVTDKSKQFIDDWLAAYPGDKRWREQGTFNELAKVGGVVGHVDDKWNATVNVNMVDKPAVKGYHGISPVINRFNMMRTDFYEDHIRFRV